MSRSQKIIFYFTLTVCLFIQVLPVIRSGISYPYGIGFWGPNGHDGVWHLSLINNLKNPLSITMPVFSGEKLANYHPLFDILIAFLSAVTTIPSSTWLFQIYPIISSAIFLWLSFKVGEKYGHKFSAGIYLMCLNSFANSFGWLVTLIRNQGIGGESLFWAMQSASNQINPPYTLSLIFLLLLLLLIPNNTFQLTRTSSVFIFLILTFAPITKAYSTVAVFGIYGIFSLFALFQKKYQPVILLFISLTTAFVVFKYYNPNSGGLLTYSPFWFAKSLVESSDRLYLPKIASQLHLQINQDIFTNLKILFAYTFCFTLFILGNFSFRLLGFTSINQKNKWQSTAILCTIFVLTLIPTIFIQNGTSWNTIQFLYYALFLSNIYLANYLSSHPNQAIIILIISLVSNYGNFQNSLGNPPPAYLSHNEITALNFLRSLPNGIILTFPYDKYQKNNFATTPIPLYAYETTSYVSAYSHHPTYVDDYMNLANSNFNYQERLVSSQKFFAQSDKYADRGFLLNNQISYIYLVGKQTELVDLSSSDLSLTVIYKNSESTIYQVQK